jgi:outer membrane protein OmpA-like peptidoglycan-associated protein
MKLKLLVTSFCIGAATLSSFAQGVTTDAPQAPAAPKNTFGGQKKGPLLGFAVNLTDYSASLPDIGKINLGASLFFWSGITKSLDYSIRYNGLFTDYALPETHEDNQLASELEASLHFRILSDDHLFNPFISAGVGGGRYSDSYVGYAPLGVGIQMNIFSETYIFLQGNYRVSFDDTKLHNSTFYSLGFAVPLRAKKAMTPPPPPPPPDRDGDGVADANDECPDAAGPAMLNGCPDKDGDGVADKFDKCPDVAGTVQYQGCPVPDADGDGVLDNVDKCPNVAGLAAYQGCPMPDADNDGVADDMDKCPNVAGPASNAGCPEVKEEVKQRLAFAATAIQFETGKATLKKTSYPQCDEIVKILNDYPDYNMTVDGYTDNTGSAPKNLVLSQDRANAIKSYFVGKGVTPERITTAGHGIESPVADNKTAAGRAKNRRVEMNLKLKD